MTSQERIEAALKGLVYATPGPWMKSANEALIIAPEGSECQYIAMLGDTGNDFGNALDDDFVSNEVIGNMDLIVAAPDLAAEVLRLRAELAELKRLL